MESLLTSAKVKLVERIATGVTLAIQPDKSRLHAEQHDVRCTASIRATLPLEPRYLLTHAPRGRGRRVRANGVTFWNRRFDLAPVVPDRRLVQTVETVAQEFGFASETRFDIPKQQ